MTRTHTPGPWFAEMGTDYLCPQVWADGRLIADVYGGSRATSDANALLLSMAPELLEALRQAHTILDGFPLYHAGPVAADIRALLAMVEETLPAIARAEGTP